MLLPWRKALPCNTLRGDDQMQIGINLVLLFLFLLHERHRFQELIILNLKLVKFLDVFSLFDQNALNGNFFGLQILLELFILLLDEINLALDEVV